MKVISILISIQILFKCLVQSVSAQNINLIHESAQTMLRATIYMVETVSTNGGYVWDYLPNFSRRWGEMEAFKTMIWLQHPGTISMGHTYLNAYETTGNDYYYEAAKKVAAAIIFGQRHEGGWNYMIDFAGDRSLKYWYSTIGKNGWRLEEFQHYYENSTFDDDVTTDAARFLLRIYLIHLDPVYKQALDKAICFVLESQYELGGWPQRFPVKYAESEQNHADYTSYYTFNDDVTWENVQFLIQCYLTLGEERFLDPINRGMYFYLYSQDSSGAWAQQLTPNMETAGARTYEPPALLPSTTCENAFLLLKFYQFTGDKRFLSAVPAAIRWLEITALPEEKVEGKYTHPTFVDPVTNRPVYIHRKGSNVKYGYYYADENDSNLLVHYYGKSRIPLDELKKEYNRLAAMSLMEVTKDSPITIRPFTKTGTPQSYYDLTHIRYNMVPDESQVKEIIRELDKQGRWLTKHVMISNPYNGEGILKDSTDAYATTYVGDETDTSPYYDISDQEYISTSIYIRNMNLLLNYIDSSKR